MLYYNNFACETEIMNIVSFEDNILITRPATIIVLVKTRKWLSISTVGTMLNTFAMCGVGLANTVACTVQIYHHHSLTDNHQQWLYHDYRTHIVQSRSPGLSDSYFLLTDVLNFECTTLHKPAPQFVFISITRIHDSTNMFNSVRHTGL